ncbi:TonB-dependent receptor [Altererythrobacter sp. CAU 1778]
MTQQTCNSPKRWRLALWATTTAFATGALVPASAWAQDTSGDDPNPQAQAAAQNDDREDARGGLNEIVVTAEKRSEGLQNIPIPITAVTGETLEKAGVKDVGDLVQLAPSLQFGTRSTNIFIAMRGIGQAGQDIGSQSGVTVSLDGVPLLNHFMMNPAFLDVERVEVLRGPQGTIAGRNATGGAINVYSKAPSDANEGEIGFTFGNYGQVGVKGFVNAALSDTTAARLSYQTLRSDGYLKNGFTGGRNDNLDLAQIRGQISFQPSSALSIRGLFDYTRDKGNPSFAMLLRRADPDRPTVVELPGYPYPRNDIENLTFYINEPNERDVVDYRAALIASLDIGDSATLTSTTGYIKHDIDLTNVDVDATPAPTSKFELIGLYAEQFTQELTLTTDLGSRADLVAGLFYMRGDSSEPLYLTFGALTNYLVYLPAETLDSYAAYAQFRYNLTDKLRLTLGGRYTIDEKSYEMDATAGATTALLAADNRWDAFTPRAVIDYTPTDDSLVYASVSRGFKSGGFNTLGDITRPVNTFDPEYVWNYELGAKAALFERKLRLGLTGFYADYTNLQQTIFRFDPETQVRFPRVENSSSAKIKGVEFEFEAAPFQGFKMGGAATYLDATFGQFCNNDPLYPGNPTDPGCVGATFQGEPLPPGATDLTGNRLAQAPEWQFNLNGQYIIPVSDRIDVTARADYKWQDRVFFDIYNNPQNSQEAYGLLNASLAVGDPEGSWSLTGWVRNAFDKRYISQANASSGATPAISGSIGLPRTYGMTALVRF